MIIFILLQICLSLDSNTPEPTEDESNPYTPPPVPTEEVINKDSLTNFEFNLITYSGLLVISLILLLFLCWKFCYTTASSTPEIPDDMSFSKQTENIDQPLADDIQITINAESTSDSQEV